jgi:hypothetical protein
VSTNGDGVRGRRPRLAFDHVQIAVSDLEEAARTLESEHGLVALPGGRHPGRGTANMIVPLGPCYLELISVVDAEEAGRLRTSLRVAGAVAAGRTFAAWAARTDDLDATRADLSAMGFSLPEVVQGRRRRPDGVELAWRMHELGPEAAFGSLPFLIEWRLDPALYPGAAAATHRRRVRGFASIGLTDPDPESARSRLRDVLADDLVYEVERGEPGVSAIVLDTEDGEIVLT